MKSTTPQPRRQRTVSQAPPEAFLLEQSEMQRLAFGALAHELGNVTSPIALISQVLERDVAAPHLRATSSTLGRVADALQVLTAISRAFHGSRDHGSLRRNTLSLPLWWQTFSAFVDVMIPASCRISADVLATAASPQRLDAITTTVPPLARAMTRMNPAATSLAISLTGPRADAASTLTRVVLTLRIDGTPGRDADAVRWMGLARFEARCAGGSITTRRSRGTLQCVLSFDEATGGGATAPADVRVPQS